MYSSDVDSIENIKRTTQHVVVDNKCLLREIGQITNKPASPRVSTLAPVKLKGCRRNKIIVSDSDQEFVIVHIEKRTQVQDHKNPNSYFETTILDREEINKIVVESIPKSEDW